MSCLWTMCLLSCSVSIRTTVWTVCGLIGFLEGLFISSSPHSEGRATHVESKSYSASSPHLHISTWYPITANVNEQFVDVPSTAWSQWSLYQAQGSPQGTWFTAASPWLLERLEPWQWWPWLPFLCFPFKYTLSSGFGKLTIPRKPH